MNHPNGRRRNTQVILVKRAKGIPQAEHFALVQTPMPSCPPGGLLICNVALSVDAGMRGWVSEEVGYASVPVGAVMRSYAVGEVLESDCEDYRPGDMLCGHFNWQHYCAALPQAVMWKVDTAFAQPSLWLSAFGISGLAAWLGLTDYVRYVRDETIVISTAAGGVGSIAGQLARYRGLRPVGLVGRDSKVQLCLTQFGYEQAINYRRADFESLLQVSVPDGIDIFFDNTGGEIADAVFRRLNPGARIIQCGTAAIVDWSSMPSGPRREREILVKELSWSGFIVLNHMERAKAALPELRQMMVEGHLKIREHILEGIEQAPGAIAMLYAGDKDGRLSIRL
jgi:hypothetical protein